MTVSEAIEEEVQAIALATGLGVVTVKRRLAAARGNMLVRNAFENVWPWGVDRLGHLTVTFARDEGLHEELAWASGLTERTVSRRLNEERGNKLLSNAFPEMAEEEAGGKEDEVPPTRAPRAATAVVTNKRSRSGSAPTNPLLFANRWRVMKVLGQGGFGTAYEVRDEKNPQLDPAVLKVARQPEWIERLRQEAKFAFNLHHTNICAYRHIDDDVEHGTFVVMHHGGTSLEALIEEQGVLKTEFALDVLGQAAAGIDYAHEHEVLHLDIKPGNILVRERSKSRREVRISDFGISMQGRETEVVGGGRRTVAATAAFGFSRAFASPEQASGRQVSRKSDQYSLALVFCAMLEGEVFDSPYSRRTFSRLSDRQNQALERALSRDPAQRFSSCSRFVKELTDK